MLKKSPLLVLSFLLLTGCATDPSRTADAQGTDVRLSEGYSLLYDLLKDEARVDGLFILRRPSDETKTLIESLAQVSRDAQSQLDQWKPVMPAVRFDAAGLPPIEVKTRKRIADETGNQLLFGGSFEVNLILSQIEATRYAAALSKSLGDWEKDKVRRKFLEDLGKEMENFRDNLIARLRTIEVDGE